MFVNAHVRKLQDSHGEGALAELKKRYGDRVFFGNLEQVPVREEVKILEVALDIIRGMHAPKLSNDERSFEAGRLHFKNFTQTPFGRILLSSMPHTPAGYTELMIASRYIVRHIFSNLGFEREVIAPNIFKLVMNNNDYPIEHFRGLFFEWMTVWELREPEVAARDITPSFVGAQSPRRYEYVMHWK